MFRSLFVTQIYSARLGAGLVREVEAASLAIAADDRAGQRWSKAHGYAGYTSYASLGDLTTRAPEFAALEAQIDRHVAIFARSLDFELGRRKLRMDSVWVNVMNLGAIHTPHIHPHSAISGTFYITTPKGSGAIQFEDPRLPMLMAAPPRKKSARPQNRTFVSMTPRAGTLLLWESWLRHGVEPNKAATRRISVSFNYRLE